LEVTPLVESLGVKNMLGQVHFTPLINVLGEIKSHQHQLQLGSPHHGRHRVVVEVASVPLNSRVPLGLTKVSWFPLATNRC
jgi:hypothetical protein